ncbi:MAG: nuclear transport factor 2 family protein [Novosphingobium sp.]|nr:nuclear transport factor 2 family protein [Novosphingobium sp.]
MSDTELHQLLAENAIRRLISAYCDAVNRLDADAAGPLFTPAARIRIAGFPELVGREAITEGMRQTFAASEFLHQHCDTGLIDVDGDHAFSRLSVFELNRKPGADDIGMIIGTYEDEYVRLAEGWRFAVRRYTLTLRTLLPPSKIQQVPGFVPERDFRA